LILMSTISPRGRCKAPISCGSSAATEAECGHHAPSMSPPRTRAKVIRTGRAQRRAPAEPFTIVAVQKRQPRRRAGPRTSGIRPVLRGRFSKRHVPVRRDGKTGSSCPCGVLTKEEVGRYALLTDGRRSNRTLISFVMRLRFAMTARTRSPLDCTGNEQGTLAATHQRGRGRTRSSCCYARNNVGCSIRWPARRETLLHPSGARPDLVADALNPAQFVSRRSILPTGNLATLC
jgi:hypothetical protein